MLTMLGTTSAFVPSSVPLLGGFAGRNYLTHMKRFGGMAGRCGTSIFSAYDKDNVGAYSYFGSGGDELIIKELKQKIAAMSNPYHEDFGCVWGRPKPEDVYIILFNPGTEQEGVHTVGKQQKNHFFLILPKRIFSFKILKYLSQIGFCIYPEYPKGSGNNVILAFESKEECDRFSQALQDQQFFEPAVRIFSFGS